LVAEQLTMQTASRADITDLEDIPNVGPSIAAKLRLIGVSLPQDLLGKDPYAMYDDLCHNTGVRHDPCVLDVFIAAVRFMAGKSSKPWWKYTSERKRTLGARAKAKEVAVLKLKKQLVERWFVYILRCADDSLYTGIAKDLDRRLEQHNAGTASRYTRSRLPVTREYQEEQPNQSMALKRELAIKAMPRKAKEAMIRRLAK
jgi:predicted GIY-YIG superfamily endonuclease